MHRNCISLVRNGILKQYPPVRIRLGTSNTPNLNIGNEAGNRLYHQCGGKEDSNSLHVQNEKELRIACVKMIEQCQVMVQKLQLHCNRPNSKSAIRRRNPRNSINLNKQSSTVRPDCNETLKSNVEVEPCPPPQTEPLVRCGEIIYLNNDQPIVPSHTPSCGPKVLRTCTVPGPAPSISDCEARTTSRKRVHSVRKLRSAGGREVTQLFPQGVKGQEGCHRSPLGPNPQCDDDTQDLIDLKSSTFVNNTCDSLCYGVPTTTCPALSPVRCNAESESVCTPEAIDSAMTDRDCPDSITTSKARTVKSRIPVRTAGMLLPLPLSDTPMQSRLRAEKRARAYRQPAPIRSQAERVVDAICQSTISCLESLGRLPRVLQTSSQQCQPTPPAMQRCAKNSMPNLPAESNPPKYTGAVTKRFHRTSADDYLRSNRTPPKVLADCQASNQLYSRQQKQQQRNYIGWLTRRRKCDIVVGQTVVDATAHASGGANTMGCYKVHPIRGLMTTNANMDADDKNEAARDACAGKRRASLKPECVAKRKAPATRPTPCCAPSPMRKCRVMGPCKDELLKEMAAVKRKESRSKCPLKSAKSSRRKRDAPPPLAGSCERPALTCSGICKGDMDACVSPPKNPSRLRKPPVPKHLLKRQPRCFPACAVIDQKLSNCEKMLKDSLQRKEGRLPDPMKVPINKCVEIRRCKQAECKVLHTFPPPPRSNKDLPAPVLPKDLCDQDSDDGSDSSNDRTACCCPREEEQCCLQRPILANPDGKMNKCCPYVPKPPQKPPCCGYREDESFQCRADSDPPSYPDPICPPLPCTTLQPLKYKNRDIFKDVPCAKKPLTCKEQLEVNAYCDPCYQAKEVHEHSDTAYYDVQNYMAAQRRMPPGPDYRHRRGKPWKKSPCGDDT